MKKAVIISCFDWYKARLEPIRELLIEKDFSITVLIADFFHLKHKPVDPRYPECTYVHVPAYKRNLSVGRMRSHMVFGKKVGEMINQIRPDLIFCQIPPNNVANECRKYKIRNPEIKLILDIIDLWPESMPIGKLKSTLPAKIWMKWRDDAIKVAEHVFTECDLYQEKLKDVINKDKTSTLYLYKDQTEEEKELVKKIIEKGKQDDIIRFAYLGSMNNIIDVDGICGVIRRFIESGKACELHAIGEGEGRERFEAAVKETGCGVHFYGPVFDEIEKIRILAPCDYAFNMMKGDISVGLTIKSIDYLSYGLPLINNIKGDTWKMVENEGVGVNVTQMSKVISIQHISRYEIFEYYHMKFSARSFRDNVKYSLTRLDCR